MRKTTQATPTAKRMRRFTQAGALLGARIQGASAKRGFAETRLLTRWAEIVGPDIAPIARPLKVSYTREGFGATLTVACDGARAPEVQMQTETIRQRVNACYGYNAISRVRIAQEDGQGFAEAQAAFLAPKPDTTPRPDPKVQAQAAQAVEGVGDDSLRRALELLGQNVMTRNGSPSKES